MSITGGDGCVLRGAGGETNENAVSYSVCVVHDEVTDGIKQRAVVQGQMAHGRNDETLVFLTQ